MFENIAKAVCTMVVSGVVGSLIFELIAGYFRKVTGSV